jgi:hypothetical protein
MKGVKRIIMNKVIRSFAALAVSVLTLTSCLSKTTFEDFKAAADEASEKTNEFTKVTFSGKYKSSGFTVEMDGSGFEIKNGKWVANEKTETAQASLGTMLIANTVFLHTSSEDKSLNYYTGNGFKIETAENTKEYTQWNEFGLLVATSDGTNTLRAAWSK